MTHYTLFACLLAANLLPIDTTAPNAADVGSGSSRIRFTNGRIGETVRYMLERSPSFREDVAALERSDSVIYIQEGRCHISTLRSCLQMFPRSSERRMRIVVNSRQILSSVAGQLAHELHHAVEVAADPGVVDPDSLRRLYERIGFRNCAPGTPECWETRAAQDAETRVLHETATSDCDASQRIARRSAR